MTEDVLNFLSIISNDFSLINISSLNTFSFSLRSSESSEIFPEKTTNELLFSSLGKAENL